MNCPDCKAAMKPLFTGHYCPNNCDRPDLKAKDKAKEYTIQGIDYANLKKAKGAFHPITIPAGWSPFAGILPSAAPPPPDDQCRVKLCGSKGTKTHTVHMPHRNGTIDIDTHYKCNLCSAVWSVRFVPNAKVNGTATPAAQGFDASLVPVWK